MPLHRVLQPDRALVGELGAWTAPVSSAGRPAAPNAGGRTVRPYSVVVRLAAAKVLASRNSTVAAGRADGFRWWTARTVHSQPAAPRAPRVGDLRQQVQASLTESERELTAGLAGVFDRIAALVGCRLRPGMGSFEDVARLTAAIRGMVVMAPAKPELSTRVHANPFGAPEAADWSQPALALASIVTAYLEPDPDVEFDEARLAEVRETLRPSSGPGRGRPRRRRRWRAPRATGRR